jgi:hypothetical protein
MKKIFELFSHSAIALVFFALTISFPPLAVAITYTYSNSSLPFDRIVQSGDPVLSSLLLSSLGDQFSISITSADPIDFSQHLNQYLSEYAPSASCTISEGAYTFTAAPFSSASPYNINDFIVLLTNSSGMPLLFRYEFATILSSTPQQTLALQIITDNNLSWNGVAETLFDTLSGDVIAYASKFYGGAAGWLYSETTPVPEPASIFLVGAGLAGLVGSGLRKKKA